MPKQEVYDCIIIGGGPGGLTAGIYLARFRCNILLLDDNKSRAALIPCSHNLPGFPEGISGKDFLARMRSQYEKYGPAIVNTHVEKIEYDAATKLFVVSDGSVKKFSHTIILATGVLDFEPDLPNLEFGILKGLIKHCIICDGYEATGKKIAILSDSEKGINEALFLSSYSDNITLFNLGKAWHIADEIKQKLNSLKIQIITGIVEEVILENNLIVALKVENKKYYFDCLYSALGSQIRSTLALELGAAHSDFCLNVNADQETSIKGLYAVGDVAKGLNQICVASSQAAIAATAIFRRLKNLP